jgi:hypothetical protein
MSILIVLRGNEEENANEEKEACKFVRDGINKTFYFWYTATLSHYTEKVPRRCRHYSINIYSYELDRRLFEFDTRHLACLETSAHPRQLCPTETIEWTAVGGGNHGTRFVCSSPW